MNFIIQCEDAKQQSQVLQHLENKATPQMTLAYTVDPERAKRMHKDSHKYVTGSEYLGKQK